jgi:uncharacterized protein (TIGR02996 family)
MLEATFWQAIQETPEDDAPRLIYADWLDDQGDPALSARAEFIRVQCELTRLTDPTSERRRQLQERERVLWNEFAKKWCAPLKPFSRKFDFVRGFPDQVLVQGATFLKHAEQVLAVAPVFSIRLRNSKEQIAAIGKCPALERLSALSLYWNHIGQKRAQEFFTSPYLGRLDDLDLRDNNILYGGVRALLSANLPRVRSLNLRGNQLGDSALELLAVSSLLGQLHTLKLSHNDITDTGVSHLVVSPGTAGLTTLDLSENQNLGRATAEAIAASPHLANLTWLDLANVELGDAGALALARSPHLTRLRKLRVSLAAYTANRFRYVGRAGRDALRERFGKEVLDWAT